MCRVCESDEAVEGMKLVFFFLSKGGGYVRLLFVGGHLNGKRESECYSECFYVIDF